MAAVTWPVTCVEVAKVAGALRTSEKPVIAAALTGLAAISPAEQNGRARQQVEGKRDSARYSLMADWGTVDILVFARMA